MSEAARYLYATSVVLLLFVVLYFVAMRET